MIAAIFLDSGPLGTLTHRQGIPEADQCRRWITAITSQGAVVFVPEITDYELRRELLRAGKHNSLRRLDRLTMNPQVRFLPLSTTAMRRAAELWADTRRRGRPTAPMDALDIDVILAAQVLTSGIPAADVVVATSNVAHLGQFCPARQWQQI